MISDPPTDTASQDKPITAAELARRFGLSMVRAHRWMRTLPHVAIGRDKFTTEVWLAAWMVAQLKNPPAADHYDPLESAVTERAAWAVGRLVEQGKLQVCNSAFSSAPYPAASAGVVKAGLHESAR